MIVEWTTTHVADFDDDALEGIIERAQEERWTEDDITNAIQEQCCSWDDADYYAITDDVYAQILQVIRARIGGYQLNMFDEED